MPKTKNKMRCFGSSREMDIDAIIRLRREVAGLLEKEPVWLNGPVSCGSLTFQYREVLPRRQRVGSRTKNHQVLRYIDTNGALRWREPDFDPIPLQETSLEAMHPLELAYWRIDLMELARRLRKL